MQDVENEVIWGSYWSLNVTANDTIMTDCIWLPISLVQTWDISWKCCFFDSTCIWCP